ncbi:MAG TPA: DUF1326 domain-containing protein [Ktedonobacterales bacterium]|nr:DUF1326 domain-containing protein [Ktedonobacterales bacterium]
MATAAQTWRISGDYFENCNCDVVCPCLISPLPLMTATPTQGACEVMLGFHVNQGSFGDVTLDDLNVALLLRTPGPMAEGNASVAAYIDERADDRQRQALQAIFTGAVGGPMGLLAPLVTQVLGVSFAPISFSKDGPRRMMVVEGKGRIAVHGLPSATPDDAPWIANVHPFNPAGLALAVGDAGSGWADYGMRWDNAGKNGHYAPIQWSNA